MQRQTREVPISVRGTSYTTVRGFLVLRRSRNDLPDDYEPKLQDWAHNEFAAALDPGETHDRVGTMEYYPNGEVVGFHRR